MRIEEKVNDLVELCILDVMDLSVEHLSYMFNVHILYNHQSNFYIKKANVEIIGLKFDKPHEMFKAFCHEVGHMFLHATHQKDMPLDFNQLQEAEADKFRILLMMPEKLIHQEKLYEAHLLMEYFNVSEETAVQRIEMLINYSRIKEISY